MSGKTTVARKLCHHYKLHHISAANVAQSVIKSIVRKIKLASWQGNINNNIDKQLRTDQKNAENVVIHSVLLVQEQLDDGNHEEDSKDGDRKAQEAKSHTDVLTDDFEEIKGLYIHILLWW